MPNQYVFDPPVFNNNYAGSQWTIQTPDNMIYVPLPFNPCFDSDSDTNFEANINIGTNLGASVSYFQFLSQPSPKREIGSGGEKIYIDRRTRSSLNQLYRLQNTVYGFLIVTPRVPYTDRDDSARVVMHPLKMPRTVLMHGDFYELQVTFNYLDVQSYQ